MKAFLKGGKSSKSPAISATKLFPFGRPSEPRQLGRRLILKFNGKIEPSLDLISFKYDTQSTTLSWQSGEQNTNTNFKKAKVSVALPICILDYLCARLENPPAFCQMEGGKGTFAAAIGNALANKHGKWGSLFFEVKSRTEKNDRRKDIFGGEYWGRKDKKCQKVKIKPDALPPDCIEIFWDEKPQNEPGRIRELTAQFRKVWNCPPPSFQDSEVGEESEKKEAAPAPSPAKEPEKQAAPTEVSQTPPAPQVTLAPELAPQTPTGSEPTKNPDPAPKVDLNTGGFSFEFKKSPEPPPLPEPEDTRIDPRLFEIDNFDRIKWDDNEGLINWGRSTSTADMWKIRDANEGVLIFGAVGSGKTSGSGAAISTALLQAGYGGLVLTAKTDEAKRWVRLCERTGRSQDCIHVTPTSDHKLNALQYEVQRPGERISTTDDLVALLRCINAVTSRSKKNDEGDKFWTLAPNKLTKQLFEIFGLAGDPFSINSFTRFVNRAPRQLGQPWQMIEYFSEVIARAEQNAKNGSAADRRMFREAFEYWTRSFPDMPDVTRGGVIASFESMAEVMNGRGIYEMLCTQTNLTPEMILSGKIVILDFPVKESSQGGLMVQATWKLLFQQAIERRADKGLPTARPVFLWEDEGHEFFSQHDVRFQPTARDCRACHVILSQNLPNFYQLGHGRDAVQAVFSAINTNIFHTNGDTDTNNWASQKIGMVKKKHLGTDGLIRGLSKEDYNFSTSKQPGETKSVGGFSINEKEELGMRPEEFSKLKKGGDGTCEAVILWLAHQFEVNNKLHFSKRIIQQEKRDEPKQPKLRLCPKT